MAKRSVRKCRRQAEFGKPPEPRCEAEGGGCEEPIAGQVFVTEIGRPAKLCAAHLDLMRRAIARQQVQRPVPRETEQRPSGLILP